MLFDTKQKGLNTLFKPYQIIILNYLWDENKVKEVGINSAQAFSYLEQFPERKSRAAVIARARVAPLKLLLIHLILG